MLTHTYIDRLNFPVQIYMWDGRGGSAPRAKLGVSLGACVNSLQLSHDSNLLLAGTLAGDVSPL